MTPVVSFRNHSGRGPCGHEPNDEFAHGPLTIPALRRVAMILNTVPPEHKPSAPHATMIAPLRCLAATPASCPVVTLGRTLYKCRPH